MIKKRYLNEFTDREKELFTRIDKDKERWSAMSIYAYFKKMFIKAGAEELEVSYRDFLKKYKHHHQKINKDTLASRIKLLNRIGLLGLTKNGQKHIYSLAADFSDSFLDSFSDSKNSPQSIENTEVVEDCQIPNTKYLNNNIYNKYITASEADAICDEVIKELDIKRKIVKNAIKLRIKQFAGKINPAGAYQYITKVAIDTYNFFRISSERANKIATVLMNKKKAKEQKKKGSFCNYQQREYTKEQYAEIEEACSGWGETYAEQQQRLKLERDEALANVTEDEFGGKAEIEAYYATLIHDEPLEIEDLGIGSGLNDDDDDDDLFGWF